MKNANQLVVIGQDGAHALAKGAHTVQDFTLYIRERDEVSSKANAEARWAFYLAPDAMKADLTAALKADEKDGATGKVIRAGFTDSKVNQLKSDAALLGLIANGTFPAATPLDTLKNVRAALPLVKGEDGKLSLDESKANEAGKKLLPLLKAGSLSQAVARKIRSEIPTDKGGTKKAEPATPVVETDEEKQTKAYANFRIHLNAALNFVQTAKLTVWEESTKNVVVEMARVMGMDCSVPNAKAAAKK